MRSVLPCSLRGRVTVFFGVASLSVAALFASSTYLLSREYLLQQRSTSLQRRVVLDSRLLVPRLRAGRDLTEVLAPLTSMTTSTVLVRHRGAWSSSSPVGPEALPTGLLHAVAAEGRAVRVIEVDGQQALVAGVRLTAEDAELYEIAPLDELRRTMATLATILVGGTCAVTLVGVGIALWAGRRLMEPVNEVADAAAEIAGGQLSLRLPLTDDPDLVSITASFNRMVDALQTRIDRDARFAADVSHELRTPLTTLVASIDILQSQSTELPERQRIAIDLAAAELARFRRLLDELIELARFDAGLNQSWDSTVDVHQLLTQALASDGRRHDLLAGGPGGMVRGDKRRLTRAVLNLLENADRYGGGPVEVSVIPAGDTIDIRVDDAGPGVPLDDRERIFARFATGGDGRGSGRGTGLGLAIVEETASSLGGTVWCTERPGGGARFVMRLPTARNA